MKRLLLNLACVSALSMMTAGAQELVYDWGVEEISESYYVGPGMKYTKYHYPDKPLLVWLVEMDLTNPYLKVEQVQSRHAVPDVLRWDVMTHFRENSYEGHNVRVAWNHDFFSYDDGTCIGLNISEGEVTCSKWGRSLLAITDEGKAEVFIPSLDAFVTAPDGTSVVIDWYNSGAVSLWGDCVLYNHFNANTLTADGRYVALEPQGQWIVNGDPIQCRVTEISSSPIQTAEDCYVLYLRNAKLNALDGHISVGDMLTVTQRFGTPSWGTAPANVLNAFHGYPSIVHDGVLHDGEFNNFENGREYELSSRVMAGISQDKTKLYIVTTELSSSSVGVDCIELSAWLVERGAWDVVNFDSGGSAAIVIDETMLNLPGRGSVRPVVDAALAVSLAPDDDTMDHITFSLEELKPMIISRTPLRVISYNKYGDIVENDFKGCSFEVVPESLGYVDEDEVFHASEIAGSGKIIARYDGFEAELPVTTGDIAGISPDFTSLVVDENPRLITGIYGTIPTGKVPVDVGAFTWTTSPEGVVTISDDGYIQALCEGTAVVTGTIGGVSFDFEAKAEIVPEHYRVDETFSDIKNGAFKATFTTSLKNRVLDYVNLPDGWTSGVKIDFDLASSRSSYIKFSPEYTFYSLPDALTFRVYDSPDVVTTVLFQCIDATGTRFNLTAENAPAGDNTYVVNFKDNGADYEIYRYPITLRVINVNLSTAANNGSTIALGELKTLYPGYASVESVPAVIGAESISVTLCGEVMCVTHGEDVKTLSIYNAAGVLLKTCSADAGGMTNVNVKELPLGVYFVTAAGAKAYKPAKVLVR